MAVNWGLLANQLGSIGLTGPAGDAIRYGAQAHAQHQRDLLYLQALQQQMEAQRQRQLELARQREAPARAEAGRRSAAAASLSISDLQDQLRRLSPEQLAAVFDAGIVPAINARVQRGDISAERAAALRQMVDDFNVARGLPEVEDRVIEMRKVLSRMNTLFRPQ